MVGAPNKITDPPLPCGLGSEPKAKGEAPDRNLLRKATGNHLSTFPRTIMKMTSRSIPNNSVNGNARNDTDVTSLGRRQLFKQGPSDRHQATALKLKESVRIATWNVRTLNQPGKLENVKLEMKRLKFNILGMSEVRWLKSGKVQIDGHTVVYSGHEEQHVHGVAVMMDEHVTKSLLGFCAISERVILVKLRGFPTDMNVIQVYAPTANSTEEEIEEFYEELEAAHALCKRSEVTVIMGDMNAKVGAPVDREQATVLGKFGLGEQNDRGKTWIDWCVQTEQVILNSFFEQHPRRLWTWKSPGDRYRNQIDFVTINRRFRNAVIRVRTYPGADCDSDHVPVVATVKVRFRKLNTQTTAATQRQSDLLLKGTVHHAKYAQAISEGLNEVKTMQGNATEMYAVLQSTLLKAAEQVLPKKERRSRKKWMTEEILKMMEERRRAKGQDDLYLMWNRRIRQECKRAKEAYFNEQCRTIEQLESKHHTNAMHQEVKKAAGIRKKPTANGCLETENGAIIIERSKKMTRWNEYIQQLFEDDRGEMPRRATNWTVMTIEKDEVRAALRKCAVGKAAGPDNITTEMLLASGEDGINALTRLLNTMYVDGTVPEEMCSSIFIALPKKAGTRKCQEHRTISLISHVTKLLCMVLVNRIRGKSVTEVADVQYGFMSDKGTRNAVYVLRRLVERALERQRNIYACFIDYNKAFDKVRHQELFKILQSLEIDDNDIYMLQWLYWHQKASVLVEGEFTPRCEIQRGVRQGCVASPFLFTLYTEMILRSLDDFDGFKIGGRKITNIRYADDTVILAESEQQLQAMMDIVIAESERRGLSLNPAKSVVMVFSKEDPPPACTLKIHDQMLKQVTSFVYLGSLMTQDGRSDAEVKRRIAIAKSTFGTMKEVLSKRTLRLCTRLRLLKCYVMSTLTYCCETWTLGAAMKARLAAAEMWFLRRMLKISWTQRVSNYQVLQRANTTAQLLSNIRRRQMEFFGHIMRKGTTEHLVTTGMVEGKRGRGRQRRTYVKALAEECNVSSISLIRSTVSKTEWRRMSVS